MCILVFLHCRSATRSARAPGIDTVVQTNQSSGGHPLLRPRPGLDSRPAEPDGARPKPLIEQSEDLLAFVNDNSTSCRRHEDIILKRLSGFASGPAADAADFPATSMAFRDGEVSAERRGLDGRQERHGSPSALNDWTPMPDDIRARPVNLDLVVRFALPIAGPGSSWFASPKRGEQDAVSFLRPQRAGTEAGCLGQKIALNATLRRIRDNTDPLDLRLPDFDAVDHDHTCSSSGGTTREDDAASRPQQRRLGLCGRLWRLWLPAAAMSLGGAR